MPNRNHERRPNGHVLECDCPECRRYQADVIAAFLSNSTPGIPLTLKDIDDALDFPPFCKQCGYRLYADDLPLCSNCSGVGPA